MEKKEDGGECFVFFLGYKFDRVKKMKANLWCIFLDSWREKLNCSSLAPSALAWLLYTFELEARPKNDFFEHAIFGEVKFSCVYLEFNVHRAPELYDLVEKMKASFWCIFLDLRRIFLTSRLRRSRAFVCF